MSGLTPAPSLSQCGVHGLAGQGNHVGVVPNGGQVQRDAVDSHGGHFLDGLTDAVGVTDHQTGNHQILDLGGPAVERNVRIDGCQRFLVGVADDHHDQLGDLDVGTVAAKPFAVASQRFHLPRNVRHVAGEVRFICVLGHHAQCLFLSVAADHHWDP